MALVKNKQKGDIPKAPEAPEASVESEKKSRFDGFETDETTGDSHAPFEISELGQAYRLVCDAIRLNKVPEYELKNIFDVLPLQEESQSFGADFDMAQEITMQLKSLKSMRQKIFNVDGGLKEGASVKDAKDFLASSSNMLQMLQKSREDLINTDRMQAMEEATIEALRECGPEIIDKFIPLYEEKLERIQ